MEDDNREKEIIKNKKIMKTMWTMVITTTVVYITMILLVVYTLEEGILLGTIIGIATFIMVVIAFYGVKLEVDAGYYECKNCRNKYVPKYIDAIKAPHIMTTRYLKCPNCNKRTWSKKVMFK